MELFGTKAACKHCDHPQSEHVSDKVMTDGVWTVVHRCCKCESDGGACAESAVILARTGEKPTESP